MNTISLCGKEYSGDELVDYKIVALMTGLSKRTIQDMTSRRDIPMYKISKKAVRYKVREIFSWVEAKKISGSTL